MKRIVYFVNCICDLHRNRSFELIFSTEVDSPMQNSLCTVHTSRLVLSDREWTVKQHIWCKVIGMPFFFIACGATFTSTIFNSANFYHHFCAYISSKVRPLARSFPVVSHLSEYNDGKNQHFMYKYIYIHSFCTFVRREWRLLLNSFAFESLKIKHFYQPTRTSEVEKKGTTNKKRLPDTFIRFIHVQLLWNV